MNKRDKLINDYAAAIELRIMLPFGESECYFRDKATALRWIKEFRRYSKLTVLGMSQVNILYQLATFPDERLEVNHYNGIEYLIIYL